MLKVRFHLGAGPHKGHFQVRDGDEVRYYGQHFNFALGEGRLHNQPTTAKRINCGEIRKTVCSRGLSARVLEVVKAGTWNLHPSNLIEVSYNQKSHRIGETLMVGTLMAK